MNTLVCDLGGTNCRLALVDGNNQLIAQTIRHLSNDDFSVFTDLLTHYVSSQPGCAINTIVVALAAPIDSDAIALTNRDWTIDKNLIAAAIGADCIHFINDFEALGYALGNRDALDLRPIGVSQETLPTATRLVLGAGTGFNCAARTGHGEVLACEAGHTTMPAETDLDRVLQARFTHSFGRCSLERILSGDGLVALYHALCAETGHPATLSGSHAIARAGTERTCPVAARACMEFARILGRSAGDLALLFQALGGVHLTGGVTVALAPVLMDPAGPFLRAFRAKGRMSGAMQTFQTYLIVDDSAALIGCIEWLGATNLNNQKNPRS